MNRTRFGNTDCFILIVLIVFFSGCSLKNKPAPSDKTIHEQTDVSSNIQSQEKINNNDSLNTAAQDEFEIVMTPFGPVKKYIEKQENKELDKDKESEKKDPQLTKDSSKIESAHVEISNVKKTEQKNTTEKSVNQKKIGDEDGEEKGGVVLNFDNADLEEVIRTFAEILKIDFIIDASLRGSVDIYTTGKIKQGDLFPIFFQILEINGLTAVQDGRLYRIIQMKDAARLSNRFRLDMNEDELPQGERIVIQLIPLKFISPSEMSKLINPFISAEGSLILHESADVIILIDKVNVIPKVKKLVETFDVDFFERYKHTLFTANYVDVDELIENINSILSAYAEVRNDKLQLIALNRVNAFFAICKSTKIIDKVQELKNMLDVPSDQVEPRIYVYSVKNSKADELVEILTSVFGKKSDKKKINTQKNKDEKPAKSNTPLADTMGQKDTNANLKSLFDSGTLNGEIKITADAIRNSLIIEAIPSDYKVITDLLKKIDTLPRQVLIEVTIAEVLLDDSLKMGVKWSFLDSDENSDNNGNKDFVSAVIGGATGGVTGVEYVRGLTDKWNMQLHTLASNGKVNVLSTPSIIATDNQAASINISDSVPVVSSTYTGGESDIIQTNVSYRNTGVMLSVTPHINEGGLVTMEIQQEVSNQVETGSPDNPSFRQRTVNTSLTVKDGQSIVIGGLISESKGGGNTGVPFLSDLPFIGFLFGFRSKTVSKNELILFLTPRVITTTEDVDYVTNEFKKKIGGKGGVLSN